MLLYLESPAEYIQTYAQIEPDAVWIIEFY